MLHIMDLQTLFSLLLCLLLIQNSSPRPFEPQRDVRLPGVSVLPVDTLEIISLGKDNAHPLAASNALPTLTFLTLSYVAYVAANLYFPVALNVVGIPVLEDFSRKKRSYESPSQSFLGSLATDFVTDVLSKTEAAGAALNTSGAVIDNSVKVIRRTSKFADDQLSYFTRRLDCLTKALSPGCLSRFMCTVGQFTSLHLPAVAVVLRNVEFENLDEYGQAFIDGTTIGSCESVFHECDLEI